MAYSLDVNWHSEGQRDVFNDPTRFIILRAGRRWGKTRGAMMKLGRNRLRGETKALWVDTTQSNVEKYVNEILLPFLNPVMDLVHWNKQQKVMTFKTGSIIHFGSAERPENLEGFGYHEIYLNEAGIILKGDSGERLWQNTLRPMAMEFEAQVHFIGTPKGLGLFKDFSDKGEDPEQPGWKTYHFTSYDNPYINDAEIDELVADMPPSVIRQEIYADFLDQEEGAPIVPYEVARGAFERDNPPDDNYGIVWGVDPSQYGDDEAALCKRHWTRLVEPTKVREHLDSVQGAAWIQDEFENTDPDFQPREILIDAIGYGAGWYDQARRLGLPVRPVDFSASAANKDRYFRKRDELWFKAAKWLETGSIHGDVSLRRELCKPLMNRDFLARHGKLKVESKEDMRKRLKRDGVSPNRADAFVITMDAGLERRQPRSSRAVVPSWRQPQGTWMSA